VCRPVVRSASSKSKAQPSVHPSDTNLIFAHPPRRVYQYGTYQSILISGRPQDTRHQERNQRHQRFSRATVCTASKATLGRGSTTAVLSYQDIMLLARCCKHHRSYTLPRQIALHLWCGSDNWKLAAYCRSVMAYHCSYCKVSQADCLLLRTL